MGLLGFVAAAGLGFAAAKVIERTKEKNTEENPAPADFVSEAKVMADELIEKGLEKAPAALDKAEELVGKAREKLDEHLENNKKE